MRNRTLHLSRSNLIRQIEEFWKTLNTLPHRSGRQIAWSAPRTMAVRSGKAHAAQFDQGPGGRPAARQLTRLLAFFSKNFGAAKSQILEGLSVIKMK